MESVKIKKAVAAGGGGEGAGRAERIFRSVKIKLCLM